MPAFPSWRSPDVTTTAIEAADIQLQLTTHLSTSKGWKAELAYSQLQVELRTAKAHRPKTNALPLDHATNLKEGRMVNIRHWRW